MIILGIYGAFDWNANYVNTLFSVIKKIIQLDYK
jgi:hypothetical protein